MTSSELISAAGNGDRTAFRKIVDTYASTVYTLCCCADPDSERALDHTLRIFRTAWNAISLLDTSADLLSWFFFLTFNEYSLQKSRLSEVLPEDITGLSQYHRLLLCLMGACSLDDDGLTAASGCDPLLPEQLRPYLTQWPDYTAGFQPPKALPEQISRSLNAEEHRHDLKALLGRFRFTIAALVIILILFLLSRAGLLPGSKAEQAASSAEQNTHVSSEITIPDTALVPNS